MTPLTAIGAICFLRKPGFEDFADLHSHGTEPATWLLEVATHCRKADSIRGVALEKERDHEDQMLGRWFTAVSNETPELLTSEPLCQSTYSGR